MLNCKYPGTRKRHHARKARRSRLARRIGDTAPLKQYQRALDDVSGRLRLLSAHTRGIVFELNSEARFVRTWTSDPQLLALPESECLGRTVLELLGPELGRRHHEAACKTVQTGESVSYEYELDVPSGHRYFACESVAVPSEIGDKRHAVFWIRDITEQVQFRKRLFETERLASVGALAAGVAHEINNPLAYMMLNAEQLQKIFRNLSPREMLDERLDAVKNCIRMIHDGAGHVKHIVNELLQLARPDDPLEPVDIRQALNLSLDITRAIRKDRLEVCDGLNHVPHVLAHHGRLVQVFSNLITNAAEAIPVEDCPGKGRIVISAIRPSANVVQIEFRDNGTGVALENQKHIFEPFFTTKTNGTGLGLTICQRIVSSFNGEIIFEHAKPCGSIFSVQLPAATSQLSSAN